jgi:glutamate-5-semialdehyde dehydrogenase
MTASALKDSDDLANIMHTMGANARAAAHRLANTPAEQKSRALHAMAKHMRARNHLILAANADDLAEAQREGMSKAFQDRLLLDDKRIEAIAASLESVAELADPVGRIMAEWTRPNGLRIQRVAVPIGVIGVIYESRPNVTADAGALTLKSGNAVILRGGSDSFRSSSAIHEALVAGLVEAGLPEHAIQRVPTRSRDAVGHLLRGLNGNVDVIVPRGGKGLVARVQDEARVPVFAHLDGNVHVYVHAEADLGIARKVLLNSKMRRTGICGAAETLLVDRTVADTHLGPLVKMLLDAGCAVRGDAATQLVDDRVTAVTEADWATEYEDAIIACGVINGLDAAIRHINQWGSHHTDCIITQDATAAATFMAQVDSAIVTHNASTQFADGGEFGFGAEIGIATGRMHARGPVGVEQLTTFKYCVHGNGQTRN